MKVIKSLIVITLLLFTSNSGRNNNIIKDNILPNIKKINKEEVDPINDINAIHIATWYNLEGNTTASGEIFHKDSLIAAYNFANFGTYLKVTNLSNNQSIIVKVTDRMELKDINRIDLSLSAFDSIASLSTGRLDVKIERIK